MPRSITQETLYHRALHYLERYAASAEGVRQVLKRSLQRAARQGEDVPTEAAAWIEAVLEKLKQRGYINDQNFAEMKVRSLRRSGTSAMRIKQKLMQKGVEIDAIESALSDEEGGDDWDAAVTFARKKKLGVFAVSETRQEKRDKHIASLARAGFSLHLIRKIIDAETIEDLEDV